MSNAIDLPKFSLAERDRRYAAVRSEMAARDLDCLIVPHNTGDWDSYQPDVRYLTCIGGGGSAAAAVFPIVGEPIALCREAPRAEFWKRAQDWVSDVRAPQNAVWSEAIVAAVRDLGHDHGQIGVVGLADVMREPEGTVSYGEYVAITSQLPDATFKNATTFMHDIRMKKSAEEIEAFEHAQVCSDAVSEAIFETARPGVAETEIYAAMMAAHISNGGEVPTMMLMSSGAEAGQTFLVPTRRKLEPNDIVVTEADTKYMGYQGQSVESICVGTPLPDYERLFEVSLECFNLILEAMKPGVPYADLVRIWENHAERSGVLPKGAIGHGLGLGQDRPRAIQGTDAGGFVVDDGHVFILKPVVCTLDRHRQNRAGNAVVVENGSARRLGRLKMEMRRI